MITVGWRELVGLPELGLKRVPAKIDTILVSAAHRGASDSATSPI